MSKTSTDYLASSTRIFREYKTLAEKAMAQLTDEQLLWQPDAESNSIYLIIKHLCGNMLSRWSDFLHSDGEKEWRNRDDEFEVTQQGITRDEIVNLWEKGWTCLFEALAPLNEKDLGRIVKIRGEEHSVMEAVNRQIAHYSSHIGQIIYMAKMLKQGDWKSLSIPRGQSQQFNNNMRR